MAQQEEIGSSDTENVNSSKAAGEASSPPAHSSRFLTSKKVTDHLANERTFLAWIRTGLAIIGFGFIVERFGLLLREIGIKITNAPLPSHYSSQVGITLKILGIVVMVVALLNFLQIRRDIDKEEVSPSRVFCRFIQIAVLMIG